MKIKNLTLIVLSALLAGGLATAAETDTNAPATDATATDASATNAAPAVASAPLDTNAAAINVATTNVATTNVLAINAAVTNATDTNEISDTVEITPTNALRMNFHDAPLNQVLNYLSKKMGFVFDAEAEVRGNATMVSEQPVDADEVYKLLSGELAKNGYGVSRDGRILTITSLQGALNKSVTPVKQASKPDDVPMNDEIATYILSVHTLNPTQLLKDLDQLIPPGAEVTANEAGNAIIMTARQRDIHRFSEILAALDGTSVSEVEVYVLNYADAKSVASELKEVFQSPDSTVARSGQRFQGGGRGGRGGGGGGNPMAALFGGDPGGGGGESGDSKNAANKAVFTSDDQMNAVIASAPPDYFNEISNVIMKLDNPSQDITEIKLFHLKYADPQEMADELGTLFPDESNNNSQNNRSMGARFNPFMGMGGGGGGASSAKSPRMTMQTLVRAVPDPRTASLMVTASKDQMEQITGIIEEMDKNPAMMQKVFIMDPGSADPATVQAALTALFSGPNTKTQPTSTTADALTQRIQSTAQQQSSSTTTSFGSSSGSGGTAGVR